MSASRQSFLILLDEGNLSLMLCRAAIAYLRAPTAGKRCFQKCREWVGHARRSQFERLRDMSAVTSPRVVSCMLQPRLNLRTGAGKSPRLTAMCHSAITRNDDTACNLQWCNSGPSRPPAVRKNADSAMDDIHDVHHLIGNSTLLHRASNHVRRLYTLQLVEQDITESQVPPGRTTGRYQAAHLRL